MSTSLKKKLVMGSGLFFLSSVMIARAATLSVSPSSGTFIVGAPFTVQLVLDTQGSSTQGVDVHDLRFNSSLLQVSGAQIASGSLPGTVVANVVDNQSGSVDFSEVFSASTTYSGAGILASVTFRPIAPGTASVSFDYTPSSTTDSNVANGGSDLLSGVTNGSFTVVAPVSVSSGGGDGGGGGGGGGYYYAPPVTTPAAPAPQSAAPSAGKNALLLSLVAQLRTLVAQLFVSANGGRQLAIGSTGTDVWALQVFLDIDGAGPASLRLASAGLSGVFGAKTQSALAEYQAKVGIAPASGYFGAKTRAVMFGGSATTATNAAPASTVSASANSTAGSANLPFTKKLSLGMTDPQVSLLQRFLAKDQALYPQGAVTGHFDQATQQAVQAFQLIGGFLVPSGDYGIVDAATRVKLNALYLGGGTP